MATEDEDYQRIIIALKQLATGEELESCVDVEDLAFGGFNNNTATEDVNWPIDSPLADGVSEDGRPMWSKLAANEAYMELYHSYFDELITNYFESGRFETEVDTLYALIRLYAEVE